MGIHGLPVGSGMIEIRRRLSANTEKGRDPAKLYCIAEHKKDIAEQVIKEKGMKLKKEPHGGARKRTAAAIEAARAK